MHSRRDRRACRGKGGTARRPGYHRRTMIACLLTSFLTCQEPPPAPARTPEAQVAVPKAVEAWSDKTAKTEVEALARLMKGTPSMAQKNQALDKLATGSNVLLLKPLAEIVEKDKSVVIRKRAAELVANQPPKEANATIRKLLKSARVGSQPAVTAELVRGLARTGYDTTQWHEVEGIFERAYEPECVPLQEAILELVVKHKEKEAVPLLLRNLDEPTPQNVDHADNPPAEYWEARWKAWSAWRGKVKDALFTITGQRFSTAAEATAWLKQNPLQ